MPEYLHPGNLFLGQFLIRQVMPYSYIEENKLFQLESVFPKNVPAHNQSQQTTHSKRKDSQGSLGSIGERHTAQHHYRLTTESIPEEEANMDNYDKVDDFLFTSPFMLSNFNKKRRNIE
jgi:hypothetical protein